EVADVASIERLHISLDYDDGYVAWINGLEVARSNVEGDPDWDTLASDSHESSNDDDPDFDTIDLITADWSSVLRSGTNVLAVAVYNDDPESSDLALAARLSKNRPLPIEGTDLCGEYEGEVALTLSESPYTVSCDVEFLPESTLRIEPGVQILGADDVEIVVKGQIVAEGTADDPIVFEGNVAIWKGLEIDLEDTEETRPSVFRNVTFIEGEDLLTVKETGEAEILLEDCAFDSWDHLAVEWDAADRLVLRRCDFGLETPAGERDHETIHGEAGGALIEYCTFGRREGYNDVIDLGDTYWGEAVPIVRYNRFLGGEDDAIDFDDCDGFVIGNLITDHYPLEGGSSRANGGGLTGQDSAVVAIGNVVVNCFHGVGYKNEAESLLIGNLVYNCHVGYSFYQDECDEPPAQAILINNISWNNRRSDTGENSAIVPHGAWWDSYCQTTEPPQSTIEVTHSIIEGGWPGAGNIDADPQFVDPEQMDFSLRIGSPGLDAAFAGSVEFRHLSSEEIAALIASDVDGQVRIDLDCAGNVGEGEVEFADIGPFERSACGADPEAKPRFIRGDVNGNRIVELADPILTLLALFRGREVECEDAVDADDNGVLNVSDAVYVLNFLFLGASTPVAPFPRLGIDTSLDDLTCDL
ncbi:MAG: hypothetical protein AAF517_16310, partial [Planctomycetota bacterium]